MAKKSKKGRKQKPDLAKKETETHFDVEAGKDFNSEQDSSKAKEQKSSGQWGSPNNN